MTRKYTDLEVETITQTVEMIEQALESIGDRLVQDMQFRCFHMDEEDSIAYLRSFHKNMYVCIKAYALKFEEEYEAFRNDPETIAKMDQIMLETIEAQGEGNDDEGNGNLQ